MLPMFCDLWYAIFIQWWSVWYIFFYDPWSFFLVCSDMLYYGLLCHVFFLLFCSVLFCAVVCCLLCCGVQSVLLCSIVFWFSRCPAESFESGDRGLHHVYFFAHLGKRTLRLRPQGGIWRFEECNQTYQVLTFDRNVLIERSFSNVSFHHSSFWTFHSRTAQFIFSFFHSYFLFEQSVSKDIFEKMTSTSCSVHNNIFQQCFSKIPPNNLFYYCMRFFFWYYILSMHPAVPFYLEFWSNTYLEHPVQKLKFDLSIRLFYLADFFGLFFFRVDDCIRTFPSEHSSRTF